MRRLSEEQIRLLVENFANMSNRDLSELTGIPENTIRARGVRMRLRKSEEYISAINRGKVIDSGGSARLNTDAAKEKRDRTHNKLIKTEKIRIKYGLGQKTKIHFAEESRERYLQRKRLERRGYYVDSVRLIAYYTTDTRRCPRLEKLMRGETRGQMKLYYEFREKA